MSVVADLTSINSLLSSIRKNLDEIKSSADSAAGSVSGVAKSGGGGGGKGSKTGNGGNKVGLGDFSDTGGSSGGSGMSGGLGLAKFGLAAGGLAISAGAAMAKAGFAGMPDVTATINRAGQFYNAGMTQGMGRAGLQSAAAATGLTATGVSGQVANYMGGQGVNLLSSAGLAQQRSVANIVQGLNMDPMAAAQAVTGMNTGSMSANLMRNFGIWTNDPRSGKQANMSQIFSQLESRFNPTGQKYSVSEVNDSFYMGALGDNLSRSGLSEDQKQLFLQYLRNKAQGKGFNPATGQGLGGSDNPLSPQYQINKSTEGVQQNYESSYGKGFQQGADIITAFNDVLKLVPDELKQFNGMLATVQGNQGLGGLVNAIGGAIGGLVALAGSAGAAAIGARAGGGGMVASGAAGMGAGGKMLAGLGIAGGVAGGVMTTMDIVNKSNAAGQKGIMDKKSKLSRKSADKNATDAAWGNAWGAAGSGAMSGAMLGAGIGSFIPGLGTVVGGLIGAGVGAVAAGAGSWFSTYNAQMGGYDHGGTSSNLGTNAPSGNPGNSSLSYTKPVNGPIVDGFGMRNNPDGSPGQSMHYGIDFKASMGTPVAASASGQVVHAGILGDYGNCVKIKHADGNTTLYGHLSAINVSMGTAVSQGQTIGLVGSTGYSTGAHLHFGALDSGGNFFDPLRLIGGAGYVSTGTGSAGTNAGSSGAVGTMTADAILSGISARVAPAKQVQALGATKSAGMSVGKGAASQTLGASPSSGNTATGSMASMSISGAAYAKQGDSYVAQDGPVNVHAGEAILTEQQAEIWRGALKSGKLGGGGNNVTINLSIAQASDLEAIRFANLVKKQLEEDNMISSMGRK